MINSLGDGFCKFLVNALYPDEYRSESLQYRYALEELERISSLHLPPEDVLQTNGEAYEVK